MLARASLADVTKFILDGTHGSPERTESGIPVLSAQHVQDGNLTYETDRFTSQAEYDAFARRVLIKPGDLLLTIVGTIGRSAVVDTVKPAVFQRSVAVLRFQQELVDPRYAYHITQSPSFKSQLVKYSNQSAQAGVYLGKLGLVEIPLPPLDEQRRIAAILDKADDIRRKRKRALELLDGLTQSIFLEMFGDPALNLHGFPLSHLDDIVDRVVDCPHTTPNWTNSGKIALRTSNLTAGGWNWSDTRFVSEEEFHARSFRAYVKPGDIVLSREGTVGIAAIVRADMEVCLGQRLVQICLHRAPVSAKYLLCFLLYELNPKRISRIMVGATSTHLNLKDLRKMRVPIPPKALQDSFERKANQIELLKDQVSATASDVEILFSSLQHRAFSGQL